MTPSPRLFPVEALARAARLELTSERRRLVGRELERMYALIDRLDEVPLGETPPATAFDARWEVRPWNRSS